MLRYFARTAAHATNDGSSATNTTAPAQNDLLTDDTSHMPVRAESTAGEGDVSHSLDSPDAQPTAVLVDTNGANAHPIFPQFYTCVDFVKVANPEIATVTGSGAPSATKGMNDSEIAFLEAALGADGKENTDDDDMDLCLDADEIRNEHVAAASSAAIGRTPIPTVAVSKDSADPNPNTEAAAPRTNSEIVADEWDTVTMGAFRTTSADTDTTSASAAAPLNPSSCADTIVTDTTAATVGGDIPSSPLNAVAETVLRARSNEQRAREDQALEQLRQKAQEQRSLEAVKMMMAEEQSHLLKAKMEVERLAAEEACALAAQLDRAEEEQRRRRLQRESMAAREHPNSSASHNAITPNRGGSVRDVRQSESASPVAPAAPTTTAPPPLPRTPAAEAATNQNVNSRRCDCLGASSGFHRQGCFLRQ